MAIVKSCQNRRIKKRVEITITAVSRMSGRYSGMSMLLDDRAHNIKLTMDTLTGPSNDIVNVYIDGSLVHTGTSWENYYRYDSEASAEQSPRPVDTMIIQARGTAQPGDLGFLFDNVSLSSSVTTITVPDSGGNTTVNNATPTAVVTSPSQPVNVTVTNGTSNAGVDYSALKANPSDNFVQVPATTIQTQSANVQIQAGTTVTASGSWNGVIIAPTVQTNASVTIPTPSGTSTTIGTVIEVGSSSVSLTFDQAVRILIAGQAGQLVGFVRNGVFTQISTVCTANDPSTQLSANGDCYINVGSDLVVWTKHFTQFVTYARNNNYVVQPGDTFYIIAQKVGLTLAQLEALNPQAGHPAGNFSLILPGDILNIGSASAVSLTSATKPSTSSSAGSNGEVLGTTTPVAKALSTSTTKPAATVASAAKASSGKILGMQWYFWLVTLAILATAGYGIYRYAEGTETK